MSIKKGTMPLCYDEAFKAGAVKMVTEQGRPVKKVASEFGICIATLRSWLKRSGFPPHHSLVKTERTPAAESLNPKSALCASSLPRKTRSSLS